MVHVYVARNDEIWFDKTVACRIFVCLPCFLQVI